MRALLVLFLGLTVLGCRKKDPPEPPGSALLQYPEKNSECTTGVSLNATTSQVEFKWAAAENAEMYELRVTHNGTKVTQTISTRGLTAKLPLDKGMFFSWLVNAKNSRSNQISTSGTWYFYNTGSQASRPPFPPEIIAPKLAQSVFKDINNEVVLEWSGSDVDDDIVGYDIYFSTETPPASLVASPQANATSLNVGVSADTVYYWKVVVKDAEGHTADSGIFEFKVL